MSENSQTINLSFRLDPKLFDCFSSRFVSVCFVVFFLTLTWLDGYVLCEIHCSFAPLPESPPKHRMLFPSYSAKIRGFKTKQCDAPIFQALESVKIQHKILFLCMYKNRFISNVILSKRSSSLANTASLRKAKAKMS